MSSLLTFLEELAAWLLDVLLWVPLKVWELFSDGLATVLEAIPVPDWLEGVDPFAGIPDGVVYFADALAFEQGLAIIFSAYGIRFLIRRLPFIG